MEKEPIIEFSDFTFQYYSQAEPTLYNINLKIYPGEKILIVGPSGSGKSTLGHCLNGLIPFYYKGNVEGSLKIEGTETRELDIFKLSKIIGTVLQDSDGQFVGLTVGEDIAFAMENDCVPHDEMHTRVDRVAAMVDIAHVKNLSPYEQRLAIARALLKHPPIYIFDDALSALDYKTDARLRRALANETNRSTMLIVTQRVSTIKHAEQIVVLDDGEIVGKGTHDQLMQSCETYREMVASQLSGEELLR